MGFKLEVNDPTDTKVRVSLRGDSNWPSFFGSGSNGAIFVYNADDSLVFFLSAAKGSATSTMMLGRPGALGILNGSGNPSISLLGAKSEIFVYDDNNRDVLHFEGIGKAALYVGAKGNEGDIFVRDNAGNESIHLNGNPGGGNSISVRDNSKNVFACSYTETSAGIFIGSHSIEGGGKPGKIALRSRTGSDTIFLDGKGSISMNSATGEIKIGENIQSGDVFPSVYLSSQGNIIAGNRGLENFVGSKSGSVLILDDDGKDSILLDGKKGDINLVNADCAEEFDITETTEDIDAGTVVVINDDGRLEACCHAYDQRVAGIISGAGDCKPGIVLDRNKTSQSGRAAVSLMGKAYCKVDANYSKIKVGDMLTTSKTIGHAMKATDRSKAFGAVIGKALKPLKSGLGLMPILITLQ